MYGYGICSCKIPYFRTYELNYLYGTDIGGTNQGLAYNHLALMKISNYKSVMASCSTFKPPGKVPIGSTYRVLFTNFIILPTIIVTTVLLRWACI